MRLLGIDYGTKKMSLALSDESGILARGIRTIQRSEPNRDLDTVHEAVEKYGAQKFVVGLPRNMDGSLGSSAGQVMEFVEQVKNRMHLPVDTWDERLSSTEAKRRLLEAPLSRKKRKQVVDKVAAAILLQGYLDFCNYKTEQS